MRRRRPVLPIKNAAAVLEFEDAGDVPLWKSRLEPTEFVFGDFVSPQLNISTQVPISTIETRAAISFDRLADVDPLSSEGVGEPTGPLLFPEQIKFI